METTNKPNEETLAAMKEAASGIELETLDVDHSLSKTPVPATIHP